MNCLYFGGSFNPIHVGHLLMARHVAEQLEFDQVILIPARSPYHKDAEMLPYADRLLLTSYAVVNESLFRVSDVEFKMEGNSYTVDVLERLGAFKNGPARYLVGADNADKIPTWHNFEKLRDNVRFVLVARTGTVIPRTLPYNYDIVEFPQVSVSSTSIRERVKNGQSISWLVPEQVQAVIATRGFYKAKKQSTQG